jgi:hypothetical protein
VHGRWQAGERLEGLATTKPGGSRVAQVAQGSVGKEEDRDERDDGSAIDVGEALGGDDQDREEGGGAEDFVRRGDGDADGLGSDVGRCGL